MVKKIWMLMLGLAAAIALSLAALLPRPAVAESSAVATLPASPSSAEVCEIIMSMPSASNTDEFLSLMDLTRQDVVDDLAATRANMMQYDAEGFGWQNAIDGASALEPQPGSWLLGAVRMACEIQAAPAVTGTVTYQQRIALPPDAIVVVTLEDVSRADAPSTVIAGDIIRPAGQQVPIAFSITYDPADIMSRNRYVVRAQIFYDGDLRWTSTTAYPVITQDSPTNVEIVVEPI